MYLLYFCINIKFIQTMDQNYQNSGAQSKFVPVLEPLMSPDCQPGLFQSAYKQSPSRSVKSNSSASTVRTVKSNKSNSFKHISKSTSNSLRNSPQLQRGTPPFSPKHAKVFPSKVNFVNSSQSQSKPNISTLLQQLNQSYASPNDVNNSVRCSSPSSSTTKTINSISDEELDNGGEFYVEQKTKPFKFGANNTCKSDGDWATYEKLEGKEKDAAVFIQKMWRGYRTRNLDSKVLKRIAYLQMIRSQQHIEKLSATIENQNASIEKHEKIQSLQTQSMNQLCKKLTQLETIVVQLNTRMQLLEAERTSNAVSCSTLVQRTFGTQTDLIAVQTPQDEAFPYKNLKLAATVSKINNIPENHPQISRPCSLPLVKTHEDSTKNATNPSNDSKSVKEPEKVYSHKDVDNISKIIRGS